MNILKATSKLSFISEIEGIKEYYLQNGLKLLLIINPSQQNITINITYLVGSRHESKGEAGMAHLLEHMLFKGTPTFTDIKRVLQNKGALFNATTWFDRTNYYETLPANKSNLKFALNLESDRMINSFISKKDLESEMSVVRNEFEMCENNAIGILHDQIMSTSFRWHNYGKSTIGNKSDIEKVPIYALQDFYKHYYQPDNAVLIIAGNFIEEHALKLVEQYFGVIKKPNRILHNTYTEEPAQDGPKDIVILRSGDIAITAAAYHIPSGSDIDFSAIQILLNILISEPSGILYKNLIKTQKATEVYGMAHALYEPSLLITLVRSNNTKNINYLKNNLINIMENTKNYISEEDVNKAKIKIVKSIKFIIANTKEFALHLSDFIAQGNYRLFFLNKDRLNKVTINDVLKVAKTYLIASNRTSGTFIPSKNVKKIHISNVKNLDNQLNKYSSCNIVDKGEYFEASAKNIDKHIERIRLQNSIDIALLYKKTRANIIQAKLNFCFGNEKSINGYITESDFLAKFFIRGSKNKTYQDIQDQLDKLETVIHFSSNLGCLSVNIVSSKNNLCDTIKLLSEILFNPKFDKNEFNILKQKEIAEITENLSDPEYLAMNYLNRLKSPWKSNSIYYVPTLIEQIEYLESLTLEKIIQFYNKNISIMKLEASFIGDFNKEKLIKLLTNNFRIFKKDNTYSHLEEPFINIIPKEQIIKIPDKQMAIVALSTKIKIRDNDKNYPALRIANYIFGESMQSRLVNRLREKEGLSYGIGSTLISSCFQQNTSITIYAMASNNTAYKVLACIKQEWNNFIKEGTNESELEEAKSGFNSFIVNLFANDEFVVNKMVSHIKNNRMFNFYRNLLLNIKKLTVVKINKNIMNILVNCKFSTVIAGNIEVNY